MMDSQETAINGEVNEIKSADETAQVAEPETKAEETTVAEEPAAEEPTTEPAAEPATGEPAAEEPVAEQSAAEEPAKRMFKDKQEVLARAIELAQSDATPQKEEIDHLKTAFYKFHTAEREAEQKAFIEGGGKPEEYHLVPDETEEKFKAEMVIIREKRAKALEEQEALKQKNLEKRLEIIEQIKAMTESPEKADASYKEFKTLQADWKNYSPVPAEKSNEVWRNYQLYCNQFYDMLKLNYEAREYDFKKNLETKTHLCEEAERLADEPDVISAFHQLQELHQEYRETGPVAKELREQLWARFKAASTVINKRHQQHFDDLRAQEEDNLTKKTALCEKAEAISQAEKKGAGDWEKQTKEIINLQTEWKKIGFAPQKMNVKIFERFRAACDDFFTRKADYFKELKAKFADNAEKKRALVEKARALQDSTEWRSTSDKLIALQKEWRTIGMVPKKLGDQLWNDFTAACNHFFEARNAANQGTRNEEHTNLDRKRDIISQLKALAEETGDDLQQRMQKLVDEYNAVGHVPFKEKDKVYKAYHDTLDTLYKKLNISRARHSLDNFRSNLKQVADRGADALDNERGRLMHRYESLKQEITTYENNLGFLNAASKKGNALVDEMNRKVEKLKDELNLVREKIKAIDKER